MEPNAFLEEVVITSGPQGPTATGRGVVWLVGLAVVGLAVVGRVVGLAVAGIMVVVGGTVVVAVVGRVVGFSVAGGGKVGENRH